METNRRSFLAATLGGAALTSVAAAEVKTVADVGEIDRAAGAPILKKELFASPVKIASIELLKSNRYYFLRARSADGAVGISVPNDRATYLYPILQRLVIPYFVGKDARDLESLIDGVYVYQSNYKLSSLALWCCVAWVEFSLLDLLGRMARKPVGELLGGIVRTEVPIYAASGNRGNKPEEEATVLQRLAEQTGARAMKFKVGGRMSNNADSLPGRSEKLIVLARKAFGEGFTLYADSNGSYDVEKSVEIGKLLEDQNYGFFEEPCPFDYLEETKQIADRLRIPVAGGEQESSAWRYRWLIANGAVQVVQPDLHYYGGFIRATRVARMAAKAGLPVTLHLSGGLGYADMLHFASFTPNMGPFQEYKGDVPETGGWFDPPIRLKDGVLNVPTGPGLGLSADVDEIKAAKPVES
ncbi:MAG: mandelate racemase/muconate lactonizing enzyme family protein [Candidatus Hydrogenedentes bacterium]|nr:mandelate racemase/muconate lactonizing enzyme family protein [Candidatus Hydrogenedentota bacterium]